MYMNLCIFVRHLENLSTYDIDASIIIYEVIKNYGCVKWLKTQIYNWA